MNFPSQYSPKDIERSLYALWEKKGYFTASSEKQGDAYVIVIPPPNITGFLHMGHALNNTIQDVLVRWKRMNGYNALWIPGTDHAGIATQNVVEKELMKSGISRKELGREKFIEEVWKWREKYGSRIIVQLKRLGSCCDWTQLRFTMDETLSKAVLNAFVKLYREGLIYKGKRIIHWCPRCTTALSDEEVEYQEKQSSLYYMKYPLVNGGFIEVATTRPETMLGDTAVAVNPADLRYKKMIGQKVKLPFVSREIPVIADDMVDMDFGTGAVKVTPSHDPNDFVIGEKHNLEFVTVIDHEGKMNEMAGEFKGLDRFECREKILKELRGMELLSKIEPYIHRIGHCYRCLTVIEPYLSSQWFVNMKPLAEPAIKAAEKGELKFYPEKWKKVYLHWLYNIKDWCISRQIWWGHRIPVWYCENENCPLIVDYHVPDTCPECGSSNITQDTDVLDTWFSSWLWPFSVFGWPEKTGEIEAFYPTDTLVTAQEILFFWVARMVMAGLKFRGEIPFENVYIHGTVRDETGRKMSKSLGNVIDPLEIIENYGADSLRFSLISMTAFGQDVFLSPSFYVKGRNFANKIWNASRFIFLNAENENVKNLEFSEKNENLDEVDIWIISLLNDLIEKITVALENFRFNEAINLLYEFFWHEFCDWYVEISKIYQSDDNKHFTEVTLPVLFYVLATTMKLLHPFIPFITEKIWMSLERYFKVESENIMVSSWPEKGELFDKKIIEATGNLMEMVTAIRDVKASSNVPVRGENLICYYSGQKISGMREKIIFRLGGIKEILPFGDMSGKDVVVRTLKMGRFAMSFEGIISISKELEKLKSEKEKMRGYLEKISQKMEKSGFLKKAPPEVVEKEKKKKEELEEKIQKIEEDIKFLSKKKNKNASG